MIAVGRPRTLPDDRSDRCAHSLGTIGSSRAAWSTMDSSSRAYGAPAATHLLKELPRGEHLAVLTGARPVELQIGACTRLGIKGERCSVALVLRCTLIVCIRRSRSDSAQHFTLTGAAPPALALRRSQAWRAGHMHLDAYDEVEPTGACLRLLHHDCRRLTGTPLSSKA